MFDVIGKRRIFYIISLALTIPGLVFILLTPFTDSVRLTEADRRAYSGYAAAQRHKGFETVTVDFGDDPED